MPKTAEQGDNNIMNYIHIYINQNLLQRCRHAVVLISEIMNELRNKGHDIGPMPRFRKSMQRFLSNTLEITEMKFSWIGFGNPSNVSQPKAIRDIFEV